MNFIVVCKKPILAELEKDLEQYDDIYLVGKGIDLSKVANAEGRVGRRLMFYIPEELFGNGADAGVRSFRMISSEEEAAALEIYRMYEFSDKFHLLSDDDTNYGCIHNYVRSGVLTEEEAYEAMLR